MARVKKKGAEAERLGRQQLKEITLRVKACGRDEPHSSSIPAGAQRMNSAMKGRL